MKLLKKIIALFILSSTVYFEAAAQNLTINSVCSDIAANAVTKGDFTQLKSMTTSRGKRELKSNGKFLFCNNGIIWNTEKPFPNSMTITPEKIRTTSASGQVTEISGKDNPAFASVATSINAIFAGDLSILENIFNINFSVESENNWKIAFTPKTDSMAKVISAINLAGNKNTSGKAQLNAIEIVEASQNTIKYIFENQIYSKELTVDEKACFTD